MTEEIAVQPDEAQPAEPKKNGSGRRGASTLQKLMLRATTDQTGRGGQLKRRRITFKIDALACEPDAFDEDVVLELEAPSADSEMAAAKLHPQSPASMMLDLIKSCLVSLDGQRLADGDMSRDVVWEALGMGGRALVAKKWNEICGVTPEAIKKADDSTRLSLGG